MSVHSNSIDWNTPTKYINLIHRMFNGVIELDPCSNKDSIVNAQKEIMLPDDGLSIEWNYRTIFVNPPFGRDFERKTTIKNWIKKCCETSQLYKSEILLLITVATNTSHWKDFIFSEATAICFLHDTRLKFRINGNENNKGCPMACAMVYYGGDVEKFYKVFNRVGYVMSK